MQHSLHRPDLERTAARQNRAAGVMLKNSLLIAWRNLRRNPLYSAINLSGLAIGLACCMAIGVFIQDELSYDRFQQDYGHIYRVVQTQKQADGTFQIASTPDPMAVQLKK